MTSVTSPYNSRKNKACRGHLIITTPANIKLVYDKCSCTTYLTITTTGNIKLIDDKRSCTAHLIITTPVDPIY